MDKIHSTYLVLDVKSGKFRVATHKRPPKCNPTEIPIKTEIKVNYPSTQEYKAIGEIILTEPVMKEMLITQLEGEDNGN